MSLCESICVDADMKCEEWRRRSREGMLSYHAVASRIAEMLFLFVHLCRRHTRMDLPYHTIRHLVVFTRLTSLRHRPFRSNLPETMLLPPHSLCSLCFASPEPFMLSLAPCQAADH